MADFYDSNRSFLPRDFDADHMTNKSFPPNYNDDYNWSNNEQNDLSCDASHPQNISMLLTAALSVDDIIALPPDHITLLAQPPSSFLKRNGNVAERIPDPYFHYDPKDLSLNQSDLCKEAFQDIQEMPLIEPMHPYPNSPDSLTDNYHGYPGNSDPASSMGTTSSAPCIDERLMIFDDSPEVVTVSPSTVSPNSILYSLIGSGDAPLLSENAANDLFSSNCPEVEALTSLLDLSMSAAETQGQTSDQPITVQSSNFGTSTTISKGFSPISSTHPNSFIEPSVCYRSALPCNSSSVEAFMDNVQSSQSSSCCPPSEVGSYPEGKPKPLKDPPSLPSTEQDDVIPRTSDYRNLPKSGGIPLNLNYYNESFSSQSELDKNIQMLPPIYSTSAANSLQREDEIYGKIHEDQIKDYHQESFVPLEDGTGQFESPTEDRESPLDLRGEAPPVEPTPKSVSTRRVSKRNVNKVNSKPTSPKKQTCHECDITFSTRALLMKHRRMYKHRKAINCEHCSFQFYEMCTLKVHLRLHTGERPFKCEECGLTFVESCSLSAHKRKHTGEKPYECNKCGKRFRLLSTLKSHKLTHTGQKPFECEECLAKFTQKSALRRHMTTHSDMRPFVCEQCGMAFRAKPIYKRHLENHALKAKHACQVCGEGFKDNKRLQTHLMTHNGGDRPYKCNKCSSEFKSLKYLNQHKRRVHNHNEEIRCEDCDASFRRKETYRSHQKVHKGENLIACPICNANFNHLGTFKKHVKTHEKASSPGPSASKPGSDGSAVVVGSSKKNDVKSPDKNSKNLIKCDLCHSTFFRTRQLKAHQKFCNATSEVVVNGDAVRSDSDPLPSISSTYYSNSAVNEPPKSIPSSAPLDSIAGSSYFADPKEISLPSCSPLLPLNKEINAYKLLSAVFEVTDKETL